MLYVAAVLACDSSPCANGGSCTNDGEGFLCNCAGTGFTGVKCETGRLKTQNCNCKTSSIYD